MQVEYDPDTNEIRLTLELMNPKSGFQAHEMKGLVEELLNLESAYNTFIQDDNEKSAGLGPVLS